RRGDQLGVDELLEVAGSDAEVAVARERDLPLLRDLEPAGNGTGRLPEDRAVGWAAAAAERAATPVEDREVQAAMAAARRQLGLRLVQLDVRREHAVLLRGV